MRKLYTLRIAGGTFLLLLGTGSLRAQGTALEEKETLRQTVGVNYDIWRQSQTPPKFKVNQVMSSEVRNQQRNYLILLGSDLADKNAELAYEAKLAHQPGILSVDADHVANTVKVTIKEEDEHDALRTYFDID